MTSILHTKYRPTSFDEVVGQESVLKSLKSVVKRKSSRVFLFSGPSGTGKTTLARICAKEFGCSPQDVIEVDAATHTGVDHIRSVQNTVSYQPLGKGKARAIILDEAHMLSKSAWNSLLKALEESPPHAYWFLCTTEAAKVPQTIKTRCSVYTLSAVKESALYDLVDTVLKKEGHDLSEDVVSVIVKEAEGSPRQLLQNLNLCWDAKTRKEAAAELRSAVGSSEAIELCRFLYKGGSWQAGMKIVNKLEGQNAESIRIVVVHYFTKVAIGAKNAREANRAVEVLDCFSTPYCQSDKMAPLILSMGSLLLSE